MTTSQTFHDNLTVLSQKGKKKKKQETKRKIPQGKPAAARRIVELAKVVFSYGGASGGHPIAPVVGTATGKPTPSDEKASTTNSNDDTKKVAATTTTTTIPPQTNQSLEYYQKLQQQLAVELQQQEKQKQIQLQKQTELWDVYKFGLTKISNINDLRDAPDAILPGNFPISETETEEKETSKTEEAEEETTRI